MLTIIRVLAAFQLVLQNFADQISIFSFGEENLPVFATYEIFVDLRHFYLYNSLFRFEAQWNLYIAFNSETETKLRLSNKIPEPIGVYFSPDTPFSFYFQALKPGVFTLYYESIASNFEMSKLAVQNVTFARKVSTDSSQVFVSVLKATSLNFSPRNRFMIDESDDMPNFILSSAGSFDTVNSQAKLTTPTPKSFNSLFSQQTNYILLTYLPFFQQCGEKGNYIFLQQLFEDPDHCNIVSPENITLVGNFDFGGKANADSCAFTFECLYAVDVTEVDIGASSEWFLANNGDVLFSLYAHGLNSNEFDSLQSTNSAKEVDFVDVTVNSFRQKLKVPTVVNLTLGYQQVNSTSKRLISASIDMGGYVLATSGPNSYTLNIQIESLSHTDLIIRFALDWLLYVVMFACVGALTFVMLIPWFGFHWMFSRQKENRFHFFNTLWLVIQPIIIGVGLTSIILFLFSAMASLIYLHKFMSLYANVRCAITDQVCLEQTFWDYLIIGEYDINHMKKIRRARFGFVMIHFGIFILKCATDLLIPKRNLKKEMGSHNSNIWRPTELLRQNFYTVLICFIIFQLMMLHISFSNLYANNNFVFLGIFKVAGKICEAIANSFLDNNLQLAVFASIGGLIEALSTCGAATLIDFLTGTIVGLGTLMIERMYYEPIIDTLIEKLSELLVKISKMIKNNLAFEGERSFHDQSDEEDGENENKLEGIDEEQKQEDLLNLDQSGTNILLSGEVHQKNIVDAFVTKVDLIENTAQNSAAKALLNPGKVTDIDPDTVEHAIKKQISDFVLLNQSEDSPETEETNEIFENELDRFHMYSGQTLELFITPFIFWFIWAFYNEINIAQKWNIKESYFVYYIIFSLVCIPFNLMNDQIFYNLDYYYNELTFYESLIYWKKKFEERKTDWINFDVEDEGVEIKNRSLHQMCYSSQHYFVISLTVTACIYIILGITTLVDVKIPLFDDFFVIVILIFNHILLTLSLKFILWLRKFVGLWVVDSSKDSSKAPRSSKLVIKDLTIPRTYLEIKQNLNLSEHLKNNQHILNLTSRLEKELFNLDDFREKMVRKNSKKFVARISEILTPKLVLENKHFLYNSFQKIFGELSLQDTIMDDMVMVEAQQTLQRKPKLKFSERTVSVIKFWVLTAKVLNAARKISAPILHSMGNIHCEICKSNWGVRAILVQKFEEFFYTFFVQSGGKLETLDPLEWQRYFKNNARARSWCLICTERMVTFNRFY